MQRLEESVKDLKPQLGRTEALLPIPEIDTLPAPVHVPAWRVRVLVPGRNRKVKIFGRAADP